MATNIVGGERRFPDVVANNFTDLSTNYPAALYTNQYAEVINGESAGWFPGWLGGTYYSKGFYKSNGTTWEYIGSFPYQASQAEMDAGTVDDKFSTPLTVEQKPKAITRTGNSIAFDTNAIYNQASPTTGNITDNLTGARQGIVQKIYHNDSSTPTFPAGWVRLGTNTYVTSNLNIIFAEWSAGTTVEYWIVQY